MELIIKNNTNARTTTTKIFRANTNTDYSNSTNANSSCSTGSITDTVADTTAGTNTNTSFDSKTERAGKAYRKILPSLIVVLLLLGTLYCSIIHVLRVMP